MLLRSNLMTESSRFPLLRLREYKRTWEHLGTTGIALLVLNNIPAIKHCEIILEFGNVHSHFFNAGWFYYTWVVGRKLPACAVAVISLILIMKHAQTQVP